MSDLYALIGSRLREERKTRRLSIERLAELAEITPSFLGLIERGERKLSVLTLDKLARALHMLPCELMMTRDKRSAPVWERKISFLVSSQTEKNKELIFNILDSLVKNIPALK